MQDSGGALSVRSGGPTVQQLQQEQAVGQGWPDPSMASMHSAMSTLPVVQGKQPPHHEVRIMPLRRLHSGDWPLGCFESRFHGVIALLGML